MNKRQKLDSLAKAELVAKLALEKKAEDLKIIDLRKYANFCDFFVILTVSSGRRAQSVVDNIRQGLEKKSISLRGQEGNSEDDWILLDLFDVVVHIFNGKSREFYKLDRLWAEAPEVSVPLKRNVIRRRVRKSSERFTP